jgi:Bacterial Ig domain
MEKTCAPARLTAAGSGAAGATVGVVATMPSRRACRTRLLVERLEARETPSGGPWTVETFDSTAPGSLPAGWAAWGSDGDPGLVVADAQAVAGRALASDGGSSRSGRAWLRSAVAADATATAAVFTDTLMPAQVIARGTNLDTGRPTYYAATVARGLEVKLLRVVDGSATELAALKSSVYLSGLWLDLALTTHGDRLQVRVRRRDTGLWLNRSGNWQEAPAAALDVHDRSIRAAGRVGVGRMASYSGRVTFDEFRVGPPADDVTPPTVIALVRPAGSSAPAGPISGTAQLVARVADDGRVDRVEFAVDGTPVGRRSVGPFWYPFETRDVPDGPHTLSVRAWDSAGNVGEATATFDVSHRPGSRLPLVPRHYSHVRYAALAYNALSIGPVETRLLRQSVDLVIPNTRYLGAIEAAAPATPQLVYSNISNLYLDLLADWLAYADRMHLPRETAFYHVSKPTPFVGDSPSSQPVTWFWNVERGPLTGTDGFTKLTSQARSGAVGDVALGGAGEGLYLGYPERFREVNVALYQAPSVYWAGAYEYPARVDTDGRPTQWKPLPSSADATQGFRNSGSITLDPPADWTPAVLPGSSARLYYVRIRGTAGRAGEVPILSTVLGRDYVNANGTRAGTIPAFDASADTDRDGYLSDAEYAGRRPGLDARFAYESRLFYPYYGQMRFVTNPSGKGVAAWAAEYHRRLLQAHPEADGVFLDNSAGKPPTGGAALVEPTDTYAADYAAVLGSVNRRIAPKWVLANTSGGGAAADGVVRQVPATIEEFALRPLAHNWSQFRDTADLVARRLSLKAPPGYLILDTLSAGGAPTDPRTRLAALAYYYLLADPDATFLMTWGGEEPASAWSRHWFDAIAFDVGRPEGAWSEFATGTDPADAALTYRVFRREYGNALVLYKPLSYAPGKGSGGTGDDTATTHPLPGNYRPLQSDGTLGPVTQAVTLRNGEGAILVPA